ncbi:MAG TPA: PAS domain S-box protein, partial [Gammaproteobacteria bacterium]|nr:PAS domain S-box protein [Gammaproteobacteria bacterium]
MEQRSGLKTWFAVAAVLVVLVGGSGLFLIDRQYRTELTHRRQHRLTAVVEDARRQFEEHMALRVRAMEDLRAFVLAGERLEPETFAGIATSLRQRYPALTVLAQLDPDGAIRHVHPADRSPDRLDLAAGDRGPAVRGPLPAAPGETLLRVSVPVEREGRELGSIQGLFALGGVIDQDLGHLSGQFELQIRDGGGGRLWGVETLAQPYWSTPIRVGEQSWTLALTPRTPVVAPSPLVVTTIWAGGSLMILFLLFGLRLTWRHKLGLDAAIAEKTFDLRERNIALERQVGLRKQTEESLRRSEARLREAQAIAHMGSWEWDIVSDTVTWSEELCRMFGVDPEGFHADYKTYLERVHPEDRARVRETIAGALEQGDTFENEYRIVWPDGTVRHLRGRGRVFRDDTGEPVRMAGVAQDITEQRAAEAASRRLERKYRAVLENASDGIAVAGVDGRFQEANRQLLENLGYTEQAFRGLTVHDIHPPNERELLEETFRNIREHGRSLTEHRVLRRDGTTYPAEVAGTLIELDDGPVALGVFRDISERKRMEAQLRAHQEDLERLVAERTRGLIEANRELEAFSYSVSHDLRGPLRAIDGFGMVLEEDHAERLDPDARECIHRMRDATARMSQRIDGLLVLARTSRSEVQRQSVDLAGMAREVARELQAAGPERTTEVRIAGEARAWADPILMRSLLENL